MPKEIRTQFYRVWVIAETIQVYDGGQPTAIDSDEHEMADFELDESKDRDEFVNVLIKAGEDWLEQRRVVSG